MENQFKPVASIRQDGEIVEVVADTTTGMITALPFYQLTADNFILTVLLEDALLHTAEHPLCSDPTCPCHDDSNLVREYVTKPLDNGLLTNAEAMRLYFGKQV